MKVGERKEERCCIWKCAEGERLQERHPAKWNRKWDEEKSQQNAVAAESGAFLPLLAISLFPSLSLSSSSPEALVEQIFCNVVHFTAFVALFSGQHFASVLKTYCPFSNTGKLAAWKNLLQVSSLCKCSLNEILFMHSLYIYFQRYRAEVHPRLISLRMISLCS